MGIQPIQAQRQTIPDAKLEQPRDLTWLGIADDRELLCCAREIAAQNQYANQAAKVFNGVTTKLNSWRLTQG